MRDITFFRDPRGAIRRGDRDELESVVSRKSRCVNGAAKAGTKDTYT